MTSLRCTDMTGGNCTRQTNCVNRREIFPHKMPLREERLLEKIKSGTLFGNVQFHFELPENLREAFINFPPIFKNINVDRDDFGPIKNDFAEKEGLLDQPRRTLISSYFLENGTIITPLLLFYLDCGLFCKKLCRFLQYTPRKCFNNFVQSAVTARREADENLKFLGLWQRRWFY